jgi:6-phosphogluconolactonase
MALQIEVRPDAQAVAERGSELVAQRAKEAVAGHGRFTFAVSGGHTPWAMFKLLAGDELPWGQMTIFQVDERVAPDGDPDRNLTQLQASLPPTATADIQPMPVTAADLEQGADDYARSLPEAFDLVHLGLGPDGHTASLVPGDPVLGVTDRLVAVTGVYQGRRRMTLTYPVLERAPNVLWLVTGQDKTDALNRLRAGDPAIPASRISTANAVLVADRAAAGTSSR